MWSSHMRCAYKRFLFEKPSKKLSWVNLDKNGNLILCGRSHVPHLFDGRKSRILRMLIPTALFPEKKLVNFLPLEHIFVSLEVERTIEGQKKLIFGIGYIGDQMPPAGLMVTLRRRGINNPVPELFKIAKFG